MICSKTNEECKHQCEGFCKLRAEEKEELLPTPFGTLSPATKGGIAILGSIFIDALLGPGHKPLTPLVIKHVLETTDLKVELEEHEPKEGEDET